MVREEMPHDETPTAHHGDVSGQTVTTGEPVRTEYRVLTGTAAVVWVLDQGSSCWTRTGARSLCQGVILGRLSSRWPRQALFSRWILATEYDFDNLRIGYRRDLIVRARRGLEA